MKNRIAATDKNIFAVFATGDESMPFNTALLMPDIKSIKEIENGGRKIIIMYFADGSKEKAVLDPDDSYSFEQGISICISKRIISAMTNGNGSSIYNKLIKHTYKVHAANLAAIEKEEKEKEERKAKEEARRQKKKDKRK